MATFLRQMASPRFIAAAAAGAGALAVGKYYLSGSSAEAGAATGRPCVRVHGYGLSVMYLRRVVRVLYV